MRLFVSYARVDKPYCLQILDTLEVHEVWYDQRLYASQQWWKEILRRLYWCEGFVYLLSPDSVASEYCRDEFKIARKLGKHIFPVLIDEETEIPAEIKELQYADLSKGLTPEAVKTLLNSIYLVERDNPPSPPSSPISPDDIKPATINLSAVIGEAAHALEQGNYDRAVFLLRQAKERGYISRFIDIDNLLHEAEAALERKTKLREAEREYKQIAALVKRKRTLKLGFEAFLSFRRAFPDYDPENLSALCAEAFPAQTSVSAQAAVSDFTLPMLEWCEVPAGMVTIENAGKNGKNPQGTFFVDTFFMSKYPVTNAQFQAFIDDPDGYAKAVWWDFSPHAREWHSKNPQPKPARFKGDDRPRENVTWYEAMAFCRWLSARTGLLVTLPTEHQWQRAAQGDDRRLYPWGNEFDKARCNTRESRIRMTTQVIRYENGVSPYGVYDMAGNVWEWCLNAELEENSDIQTNADRAVRGGSFIGVYERAQIPFHFYLSPVYYYATIGFRLVYTPPEGAG